MLYRRAPRLFAELATARGEGRLARLLRTLERTRLLIIDDWGPEPLNAEQRRDLLEIVNDRHDADSNEGGHLFQPHRGHHSNLIAATLPI